MLPEIEKRMPFSKGESFTYIEPFVGSGAVFFWILNNYPKVSRIIVNDINADLVNLYQQIATNVEHLIELLEIWQKDYHLLENDEVTKKEYYYANQFTGRCEWEEPATYQKPVNKALMKFLVVNNQKP